MNIPQQRRRGDEPRPVAWFGDRALTLAARVPSYALVSELWRAGLVIDGRPTSRLSARVKPASPRLRRLH